MLDLHEHGPRGYGDVLSGETPMYGAWGGQLDAAPIPEHLTPDQELALRVSWERDAAALRAGHAPARPRRTLLSEHDDMERRRAYERTRVRPEGRDVWRKTWRARPEVQARAKAARAKYLEKPEARAKAAETRRRYKAKVRARNQM